MRKVVKGMKEIIDCYGKKFIMKELSDFDVGDQVMLPPQLNLFKGDKGIPQYLGGDILVVEKICRKNLKCSNAKYPGEYWFIPPHMVEKVNSINQIDKI